MPYLVRADEIDGRYEKDYSPSSNRGWAEADRRESA